MAFGFPVLVRTALLDALTAYAGSGAILKIFSGSRPATGGAETTKLAQLTFSGNIAGAASAGVLTLNIPPSDTSARWTSWSITPASRTSQRRSRTSPRTISTASSRST